MSNDNKKCKNCGEPLEDNSSFCSNCGQPQEVKKDTGKEKIVPIMIAVSAIIGILECLGTPILIGYDSIGIAAVFIVIGAVVGYYLLYKKQEPLISVVELIITAIIIYLFIGRFGEISGILFVVTAILVLYFKGHGFRNKKLIAFPVATIVLPFIILIAASFIYGVTTADAVQVGNVTNDIEYSYGSYSGSLEGDVHIDTDFSFLTLKVEYYDQNGKIIDTAYGLSEVNAKAGQTYKFDAFYYSSDKPNLAQITVTDSDKNVLFENNVTIYQ